MGDLGLGLLEFGGVDGDLRYGFVAGVCGEEIFLLGVVESLAGDYAFPGHLDGAIVGAFVHGEVGGFGVDAVVRDGGGGGASVGFGGVEIGLLCGDLGENFNLVELGEGLSGVDLGVDVDVETGDDAGGLGLNFNLGDGLHLAGGDDGASDVAAFRLGELGRLELASVAAGVDGDPESYGYNEKRQARPDPEFLSVLALRGHGGAP